MPVSGTAHTARRANFTMDQESASENGSEEMSLGTILLVLLILILVGVIPTWPHSKSWGYAPSSTVGVVVVVLVVLLLMGRI